MVIARLEVGEGEERNNVGQPGDRSICRSEVCLRKGLSEKKEGSSECMSFGKFESFGDAADTQVKTPL